MIHRFTIPGKLHGLNEYINSCRANPRGGNQFKRNDQSYCALCIRQCLRTRITKPVIIHYHWYEKNRRRDLDNISGYGHKVIQDALVSTGVLIDDGWKFVSGFTDEFSVDSKNPRIVVELEET